MGMTWDELLAQVRALRVTLENNGTACFMWILPGDPPVAQEVRLELGERGADVCVVVSAPVAGQGRVELEREVTRGNIALIGEMYFVRRALPLASLVWNEFVAALDAIVIEAVRLRHTTHGARPQQLLNIAR